MTVMELSNTLQNNRKLHAALISSSVFAVFGKTIFFDFVWDDTILLLGKRVYETFDLGRMLFSPGNALEYLPVRDLSYTLDYSFWGPTPMGFHVTNTLLYLLNAFFVYAVTIEIIKLLYFGREKILAAPPQTAALITTLLFVAHPIHSEPVSFVSCRNVLLSGLFFFISCFFFLKFLSKDDGRQGRFYVAALVSFAMALFSKATVLVLPLIFFLFLAHAPQKSGKKMFSSRGREKCPKVL